MTSYSHRLNALIQRKQTPALVGLDPRWDSLPEEIRDRAASVTGGAQAVQAAAFEYFCLELIDIVGPFVPAVKPQVAFFEQLGPAGIAALQTVIRRAREAGLIVIADAKRGDIGSTAAAYAASWLAGEDPEAAPFSADALTINAYLGQDTLEPFVETAVTRGAGLYILVKTSNPGAAVFQDRQSDGVRLYETVADVVQQLNAEHFSGDTYGSVGAVVGATWPQQLGELRQRMPNAPLLVPGYGSQGGTAADVAGAFDATGLGAVINSSRAINFAHLREDRPAAAGWRDAVEWATKQMVADLQTCVAVTH